ncbi:MAG: DUF4167 domain-containing protein [Rhodospirillales bacterium]|nr:DUF4167 domain-containing protein [Rhodospirillales bacterium]
MKQGSNSRQRRGRSNGRRPQKNSNFDSNGPEVRVRGSAQQVYEKYLALARDTQLAGDRVSSENYSQHAEHYFRIISAQENNEGGQARNRGGQPQQDQDLDQYPDQDQNQSPPVQSNQPNNNAAPQAKPDPSESEQPVIEAQEQAGSEIGEATVELKNQIPGRIPIDTDDIADEEVEEIPPSGDNAAA